MENNTNTAMVGLDFSAAFDTVNLRILLDVLNKYFGIQRMALKWIKSYLTNRQFGVQTDDQFSDVRAIDFSVPHGSILGPVLFTCYVSTLQELFTDYNSLSANADDHLLGYYLCLNTYWKTLEVLKTKKYYYFHMTSFCWLPY